MNMCPNHIEMTIKKILKDAVAEYSLYYLNNAGIVHFYYGYGIMHKTNSCKLLIIEKNNS